VNVGLASLRTTKPTPSKLGRQLPGGVGLRETRGKAEAAPRRERVRATALYEENIMV